MPFNQIDSIRYYSFESFEDLPVVQAVFTRQGGVSPAPWESLNTGATVGDHILRVGENRRRAFSALGRSLNSMYDVWQVHSTEIVAADAPRGSEPHLRADVILTDRADVTIFMRFADCVPVLLYDPVKNAAGMVHAGWQGTVNFIVRAAVEAMRQQYGSQPQDLFAGIGPSIGAHHYPVGQDVIEKVQAAFGDDASGLLPSPDGEVQFDLWAANKLALEWAGVQKIEVSGVCTACHTEDWFSHRAEKGRTGRFGVLLALR